jgi:hypothetical protein
MYARVSQRRTIYSYNSSVAARKVNLSLPGNYPKWSPSATLLNCLSPLWSRRSLLHGCHRNGPHVASVARWRSRQVEHCLFLRRYHHEWNTHYNPFQLSVNLVEQQFILARVSPQMENLLLASSTACHVNETAVGPRTYVFTKEHSLRQFHRVSPTSHHILMLARVSPTFEHMLHPP